MKKIHPGFVSLIVLCSLTIFGTSHQYFYYKNVGINIFNYIYVEDILLASGNILEIVFSERYYYDRSIGLTITLLVSLFFYIIYSYLFFYGFSKIVHKLSTAINPGHVRYNDKKFNRPLKRYLAYDVVKSARNHGKIAKYIPIKHSILIILFIGITMIMSLLGHQQGKNLISRKGNEVCIKLKGHNSFEQIDGSRLYHVGILGSHVIIYEHLHITRDMRKNYNIDVIKKQSNVPIGIVHTIPKRSILQYSKDIPDLIDIRESQDVYELRCKIGEYNYNIDKPD